MFNLAQKLLLRLPPEVAHSVAVGVLQIFGQVLKAGQPLEGFRQELFGINFRNRIGIAAGFDKDGQAIEGLSRLGFGFVEAGTVTPYAQPGNSKPRLFRFPDKGALINRMGFNNLGLDSMVKNLEKIRSRSKFMDTVIGVNLGKNKSTPLENAYQDYLLGIEKLNNLADYITLNLSSPNTPGLRSLQTGQQLEILLDRVKEQQARQKRYVPLLLKVSPDLSEGEIELISEKILEYRLEGLITTNTTTARPVDFPSKEGGGLSGAPLLQMSLSTLSNFRRLLPRSFPIIGVGGITDEGSARQMIEAGADLLQIYTGFVLKGTKLVHKINKI